MQIRAARERLGMSRDELAAKLGCSVMTIYNWEKGRTRPSRPYRRILEERLGIKISGKPKK